MEFFLFPARSAQNAFSMPTMGHFFPDSNSSWLVTIKVWTFHILVYAADAGSVVDHELVCSAGVLADGGSSPVVRIDELEFFAKRETQKRNKCVAGAI